jgi:hypothetical protein
MNTKAAISFWTACVGVALADPIWVEGAYRNPAVGYSIKIPHGLKGTIIGHCGELSREAPGACPQRGLSILLPSGGEIAVLGEPNSFLWSNPAEGVREELAYEKCASDQREISQARVGKLNAATGRLVCGDRVLKLRLAFRPGGGLIYWLRLNTVRAHESEDDSILDSFAMSFKLIRWK